MTERDLRRHFNAPPTFDIGNHLRELGRVFIPALIGAILIAVGVYQLSASQPDQYEVGVTAKIDSADVGEMTDVTVNMLAPPFVALSQSSLVLEDIRERTGTSMSAEELSKNLVVTVQTSPALVLVSVTAPTPEEATELADAAVTSLDEAGINLWNDKVKKDLIDLQNSAWVTADEMSKLPDPSPARDVLRADYEAQVARASQLQAMAPTRLGLLATPEAAVKVAPKPLQQALVVGLSSLLVLLELLAFLNGRLGRRTNAAWVRRMARKHGYAVENAKVDALFWPRATHIQLNKCLEAESGPLVLYPQSSSGAKQFVQRVNYYLDRPAVTCAAESDWWTNPANGAIPLGIVVVDRRDTSRKSLKASFDALDDYGMAVQLVSIRSKRSKGAPKRRSGGKHQAVAHAIDETEIDTAGDYPTVSELDDSQSAAEYAAARD